MIYDRLDLLLTTLIVSAMALPDRPNSATAASFAVLAAAVLFKIVPVVLAPLWVVGAMPADRRLQFRQPGVLTGLAGRSVLLLALIAGGFLPFYFRDGERSLSFLVYHGAPARLVWLRFAAFPASGSFHLLGAAPHGTLFLRQHQPRLAPRRSLGIAEPLVDCRCLAVSNRPVPDPFPPAQRPPWQGRCPRRRHLLQVHALPLIDCTLLFHCMLFIATNKVFSTQYLAPGQPPRRPVTFGSRGPQGLYVDIPHGLRALARSWFPSCSTRRPASTLRAHRRPFPGRLRSRRCGWQRSW